MQAQDIAKMLQCMISTYILYKYYLDIHQFFVRGAKNQAEMARKLCSMSKNQNHSMNYYVGYLGNGIYESVHCLFTKY